MEHIEGAFTSRHGLKLFYQGWRPQAPPVAKVVVAHGLAEHSGRYERLARHLTGKGYAVYSYDQRGNLLSDGVWTYTYNGANRMVRAAKAGATQVYTYTGDGLLAAQNLNGVPTTFTWD